MTLLASITAGLGTCQESSRSPGRCCALLHFHVSVFGSGNHLFTSAPLFSRPSDAAPCLRSWLRPRSESLEGLGAPGPRAGETGTCPCGPWDGGCRIQALEPSEDPVSLPSHQGKLQVPFAAPAQRGAGRVSLWVGWCPGVPEKRHSEGSGCSARTTASCGEKPACALQMDASCGLLSATHARLPSPKITNGAGGNLLLTSKSLSSLGKGGVRGAGGKRCLNASGWCHFFELGAGETQSSSLPPTRTKGKVPKGRLKKGKQKKKQTTTTK